MSTKKLYAVLGVPETATTEEIKSAYKKLAAILHPDKCKDRSKVDEYHAKFTAIGQANEILSDINKRQIYDQVGDDNENNIDDVIRQQEEMKNMRGMFGQGGFPFGAMFGNDMRGGIQIQFNPNITFGVKLTLEEIFAGKQITQNIKRQVINIIDGKPTQTTENETITIQIPKGVRAGENIAIAGGNKLMQDGVVKKQGNIVCVVEEKSHPIFQRSQAQPLHLLTKHTISIFQALLGDFTITLVGIDGNKFNVSIGQSIIQPETVICVAEKGMVANNGKKGNMYITFNIEYPKQLSDEQRTALENMTNYVKSSKKSSVKTSQLTIDELQHLINTPDHEEQDQHNDPFAHMFGSDMRGGRRAQAGPNVQCAQQ